jgi:hypothetical protein
MMPERCVPTATPGLDELLVPGNDPPALAGRARRNLSLLDAQAHGALMIGIPGQFERDLTEINTLHASVISKVQIIRNADLRTTVQGDARVQAKTRNQIDDLIDDYAARVRAAAGIVKRD